MDFDEQDIYFSFDWWCYVGDDFFFSLNGTFIMESVVLRTRPTKVEIPVRSISSFLC